MNDMVIGIRLKADGSGLVGEVKLSRREIEKLKRATEGADRAAVGASRGTDRFGRSSRQARQQMRGLRQEVGGTRDSLHSLKATLAGLGVGILLRQTVQAGLSMEALKVQFTVLTGSSEEAAEALNFVRTQAERLGVDFVTLAKSYADLTAATQGTGLATENVRQILLGVAEAGVVNQRSSAQIGRALNAIQQIASKGVVSMEEVRQQLAEAIPGAVPRAAKAMGLLQGEFNELVASGELLADDFLPRFARQLRGEFSEGAEAAAESARAAFARLQNSVFEASNQVAVGLLPGLEEAADALKETFNNDEMKEALIGLGEGLGAIATGLADVTRLAGENADLLKAVGVAYLTARGAALAFAVAQGAVNIALLANPIGAVITLIGAAAGGYYLYTQRVEAAREAQELYNKTQETWLGLMDRGVLATRDQIEETRRLTEERLAAASAELRQAATSLAIQEKLVGSMAGTEASKKVKALADEIANLYDRLAELDAQAATRSKIDFGRALIVPGYEPPAEDKPSAKPQALEFEIDLTQRLNLVDRARLELKRQQEEIDARHADTVAEIRDRLLGTLKPYDEAVARARLWRDQAIAGLDETKAGYEDFRQQIETIFQHDLKEALDLLAESQRTWRDGAVAGFQDYADAAADAATQVESAMGNAFGSMEDEIVDVLTRGKFEFADFADSVIRDLARIFIRQQLLGPIAGALGNLSFFSGGAPAATHTMVPSVGLVPTGHTGATIGQAGSHRPVDMAVFQGAPRFHRGGILGQDEVPFIGLKGEQVGFPDDLRRQYGRQVNVQVIDQRRGGEAIQVEEEYGQDGLIETLRVLVRDEVDQGLNEGRFDGAMGRNYGINRAGGL